MKDENDRRYLSQPPPGNSFDGLLKSLIAMMILAMVIAFAVKNCSQFESCCSHTWIPMADAAVKKEDKPKTEFVRGLEHGRSFLRPKSAKGQKHRDGIKKMIVEYRAWIWKYARYTVVKMARRIWIESRGNDASKTKDSYLLENGLTSVTYDDARRVCDEFGVCGDVCGDPELAIAITAYSDYRGRVAMFMEPDAENGEKNFWYPWLMEQWEYNPWEAEAFAGACRSINCQKLRKAITMASKQDGFMTSKHKWWQLVKWFRTLDEETTQFIFEGVKKSIWNVGARIGMVEAALFMRAEFKKPLPDGSPDYGFGPTFAYFPMRVEMREVDGVIIPIQVPDFPKPLHPYKKFPKREEWQTNCVLYGTKAWHNVLGKPKATDRWKTGGFKYHPLTGDPITVKKGQRKYPAKDDFTAAHAAWIESMIAQGRYPTPEANAAAAAEMQADSYLPLE